MSTSNDKNILKRICFHCNKAGHLKGNCKLYLDKIQKKKHVDASKSVLMFELNLSQKNSSLCILDTGSAAHICNDLRIVKNRRSLLHGEVDLLVGNGASVAVLQVGDATLSLANNKTLVLTNCYYVPEIVKNIISISRLTNDGFKLLFENNGCSIFLNKELFGHGTLVNGLYVLDMHDDVYHIEPTKRKRDESNMGYLWHCRLGHISEKRLNKLVVGGYLGPFDYESYGTCESCIKGKMTKVPLVGQGEKALDLLDLIHTDVCGPMSIHARGGYSYFITFTDDYSRFGYVYLMKYKSEAYEFFKEYKAEVEKQTGKSIKVLRSDRGGEYLNHEFLEYLKEQGIRSQWTPPATPQLNGVSERRNRTLLDMVRSMMELANLSLSFWGYALETTAYLLNKVPSKLVSGTPHEMWTGKKVVLNHIKAWGCPAYVKRLNPDKLEARSCKCYFVGYPRESRGYYFYNPEEQKVFVSKNAIFLESELLEGNRLDSRIDLEEIQEPQVMDTNEPIQEPSETVPLRKSIRTSRPPERYFGYID